MTTLGLSEIVYTIFMPKLMYLFSLRSLGGVVGILLRSDRNTIRE
jgi:hypothetical protein